MKPTFTERPQSPGEWVGRFMAEMHRYDRGRTLPVLHAARLTTAQLAALEAARQPTTVSAMANDFGLSLPAMSQLAEKLVRQGLLLRSERAEDRRQRHLSLTAKGRSLLGRVAAARAARFDAALDGLPPALAEELSTLLARVVAFLCPEPSQETSS